MLLDQVKCENLHKKFTFGAGRSLAERRNPSPQPRTDHCCHFRGALNEPVKAKLARQLGMLLFTLNPQATVLTVKGNDGSFVPHVSQQVSYRSMSFYSVFFKNLSQDLPQLTNS